MLAHSQLPMQISMNIQELEKQFAKHEAVTNERFLELLNRVKRLEHILIGVAGFIIVLLVNIVMKMG